MLGKSLLLFVVGSLNILIGLLVLTRDYRKLQHQLFFFFSLGLAGWVIGIGGFLLSQNANIAFHWAKVYYLFPLVVAAFMPLFSYAFPGNRTVPKWLWYFSGLGFFTVALPLLLSSDFLTTRLIYHDWGKEILLNKADYLVYSVYLLSCFGIGLVHAFQKSRHSGGIIRSQVSFYFYGFLITSTFGVYFNLILPWFGNYRLIWLGPLFTNFFVMAIAYSIIRHRLFDIRLVVARALAYVSSLLLLATFYGFLVFGIAQWVFDVHFTLGLQIAFSAATGVAVVLFQRVKKFFDKATNRLFYSDAYDVQELFNDFNKAIVSTIELNLLLKRAASTISDHLKAEYCIIGVKDDGSDGYRIVGTQHRDYGADEIKMVRAITPRIHRRVIISDNLEENDRQLGDILIHNDISVLVRITANQSSNEEGLGYIVLGRKRSGALYNSKDEKTLEALANELIVAVENALRFEEIERFNMTLQQKVEDATRRLRQTNAKLKKLNDIKDDFIGMASHQLRTPLTSVKGYVSLVIDEDAGKINATQRTLLQQAFTSTQRVIFLVSDLLNVSRLKSGKFVIERKPTDLSKMIEEEITQLRIAAGSRDISIGFEKPAHFPALPLDEQKTRQVVMNFLDNAIYYGKKGGHIDIILAETEKSVELRVVDDGIGVPKSEQHNLWTKFYRAKNAQRARPDGTGLGLFMAKKIIVAEGGSTIFDSKEGLGSTFGFIFPKDMPMDLGTTIVTDGN